MLKTDYDYYIENNILLSQKHPYLPLTIWNYTLKTSYEKLWDDVTISHRGLVTDENYNIIARPFKKFFNLSERKTTLTSDYKIYNKFDGSLGILFNYEEE